jgi:hypothetical protein
VGVDSVMLEQNAFALPQPAPDKGAAQIQDALLALSLKGSFGNIASGPFRPELDNVLS